MADSPPLLARGALWNACLSAAVDENCIAILVAVRVAIPKDSAVRGSAIDGQSETEPPAAGPASLVWDASLTTAIYEDSVAGASYVGVAIVEDVEVNSRRRKLGDTTAEPLAAGPTCLVWDASLTTTIYEDSIAGASYVRVAIVEDIAEDRFWNGTAVGLCKINHWET
jgi:hypothetical protein